MEAQTTQKKPLNSLWSICKCSCDKFYKTWEKILMTP